MEGGPDIWKDGEAIEVEAWVPHSIGIEELLTSLKLKMPSFEARSD